MENPEGPRGQSQAEKTGEVMGSKGSSKAAGSLGVSGWRELRCWVFCGRQYRSDMVAMDSGGRMGECFIFRVFMSSLSFLICREARERQRSVPHSDKGIKAHGRIKSRQRGVHARESQHGSWKTQWRHLVVYLAS